MSRDDCSPVERALKVLYPTDICTPTRHSPTDICIHLCCCLQESMRLFKQCDADRPFACSCTCMMYHTLCRHSMKFHIVLSWPSFFPLSLICTFFFWGRTILLGILSKWPSRISTWHVKRQLVGRVFGIGMTSSPGMASSHGMRARSVGSSARCHH